jgi:hypothetical protein
MGIQALGSSSSGTGAGIGGNANFLKCIPLTTTWALAYPLGRLLSTVAAHISYLVFCHICRLFNSFSGLQDNKITIKK